jgi:hypothetical protein
MDTYLNLHNFFSFLPFSFCPLSFFFSHLSSLFTLPGTIQLFNYFCSQFSLCRGHLSAKHFYILSLIPFFLTLQILFTIMDIVHCYFTFDQNNICISISFWNKKSKHTSFLHLRLTTTVLKTYLHLLDNKSFQDALMSISSPDCIL